MNRLNMEKAKNTRVLFERLYRFEASDRAPDHKTDQVDLQTKESSVNARYGYQALISHNLRHRECYNCSES